MNALALAGRAFLRCGIELVDNRLIYISLQLRNILGGSYANMLKAAEYHFRSS
jgi:hypothetical protein